MIRGNTSRPAYIKPPFVDAPKKSRPYLIYGLGSTDFRINFILVSILWCAACPSLYHFLLTSRWRFLRCRILVTSLIPLKYQFCRKEDWTINWTLRLRISSRRKYKLTSGNVQFSYPKLAMYMPLILEWEMVSCAFHNA